MKKSVFSETEKAFISEKISSKKKNLRGTFPDLSVKSLQQHPWHVILYSLVFLYGITSTAVFWRLAWEVGVRRLKGITFAISMSAIVHVTGILLLVMFFL